MIQKLPLLLFLFGLATSPVTAQGWRAEADQRIDEHRKADFQIEVRGSDGGLIEGADVHVRMQRHAFNFGTAVRARYLREGAALDYRSGTLRLGDRPAGFRFALDVPAGASITSAHVRFTSRAESSESPTQVTIRIEDAADAESFRHRDIQSRPTLPPTLSWDIPAWVGENVAHTTPDLAELLQAVVDRQDWQAGQHVMLTFEGSGDRRLHPYQSRPDRRPTLVVATADGTVESPVAALVDNANERASLADSERYREEVERLFNYATIENMMKWHNWELTPLPARDAMVWLEARDFTLRGHTLVWNTMPDDVFLNSDDIDYVRSRLDEFITAIMTEYNGRLAAWDALNEVYNEPLLPDHLGVPDYVHWTQLARSIDPDVPLYINDYSVIEGGTIYQEYAALIQELLDAGAELDGIGLQGHFWWQPVPPEVLWERMQYLAAFNLPFDVTEFDMRDVWTEEEQATQLDHVLTIFFSHPLARTFQMWGFWDDEHWRGNAALFDADWNLKPSGEVWYDLVFNQWWTDEQLATAEDGIASLRGFLGEYEIEVAYEGHTTTVSATLDPSGSNVVVTLPVTSAEDEADQMAALTLHGSYPNPSSDAATLVFDLGEDAEVSVELFDLLGREVLTTPIAAMAQGAQRELTLDTTELASGTYVYRLHAATAEGTLMETGRLTVVNH